MKILVYGILIGIIICVGVACITYFHQESAQLLKVKELVSRYGLIGVFLLTIISGTILPLGSPAIVATGAGFGLPAMPLAAVAALGYTLGVMISYLLGYLGRPLAHKKLRDKTLRTLTNWWDRYGWMAPLRGFRLCSGSPLRPSSCVMWPSQSTFT